MPDQSFQIRLTKEEAAVFCNLCITLQMYCSFREATDLKLLTELQKTLAETKDKPEPIVMQITLTNAKNLWDLLAAAKITCKFLAFEDGQFYGDIQKTLQLSSSLPVARVTQKPAASR